MSAENTNLLPRMNIRNSLEISRPPLSDDEQYQKEEELFLLIITCFMLGLALIGACMPVVMELSKDLKRFWLKISKLLRDLFSLIWYSTIGKIQQKIAERKEKELDIFDEEKSIELPSHLASRFGDNKVQRSNSLLDWSELTLDSPMPTYYT